MCHPLEPPHGSPRLSANRAAGVVHAGVRPMLAPPRRPLARVLRPPLSPPLPRGRVGGLVTLGSRITRDRAGDSARRAGAPVAVQTPLPGRNMRQGRPVALPMFWPASVNPPAGPVVHVAEIPPARDRFAAAPALEDLPALHPTGEVGPNQLVLLAVTMGFAVSHRVLSCLSASRGRFFVECGAFATGFTLKTPSRALSGPLELCSRAWEAEAGLGIAPTPPPRQWEARLRAVPEGCPSGG
jgi:hypothetical protein